MHMQISSVAAESRNKSYDVIFILSCSAVERLWNDCWGATSTLRPPSLPHISHLLKQIVVVIAVKFVFNFFLSSSNETSNSKTFPPTSNEITLITVSEVFFLSECKSNLCKNLFLLFSGRFKTLRQSLDTNDTWMLYSCQFHSVFYAASGDVEIVEKPDDGYSHDNKIIPQSRARDKINLFN